MEKHKYGCHEVEKAPLCIGFVWRVGEVKETQSDSCYTLLVPLLLQNCKSTMSFLPTEIKSELTVPLSAFSSC